MISKLIFYMDVVRRNIERFFYLCYVRGRNVERRPVMPRIRKFENRQKRPHGLRKDRKLCRGCWERPALFIIRVRKRRSGTTRLGRRFIIKIDRDHDLCIQCHRSLGNSFYTRQLFSGGW